MPVKLQDMAQIGEQLGEWLAPVIDPAAKQPPESDAAIFGTP